MNSGSPTLQWLSHFPIPGVLFSQGSWSTWDAYILTSQLLPEAPPSANTIMLDISFQHMILRGQSLRTYRGRAAISLKWEVAESHRQRPWAQRGMNQGLKCHQSVAVGQFSHIRGNCYHPDVQLEKCRDVVLCWVSQQSAGRRAPPQLSLSLLPLDCESTLPEEVKQSLSCHFPC